MSTEREATYKVFRSQGITTVSGNPRSNEERSSLLTPALPGAALNWIDGEWVDANKTTDSLDPVTGEQVGPCQFRRETGIVVGVNSATAQCGEGKQGEWQELLARLSTGCKF